MLLKRYQIDERLLRTGAASFSASGLKWRDNDLVVIESTEAGGQAQGFASWHEHSFRPAWVAAEHARHRLSCGECVHRHPPAALEL